MRSYGRGLPFLAAVVVLPLVINLGVSLPNAPANVGSYQFFCVLGLNIFEVEKNTRSGFFITCLLHAYDSLPVSRILRGDSQWAVDAVHARADDPVAE